MKTSTTLYPIFVAALLVCVLFTALPADAAKQYTMKGDITAIDRAYNTVVIEVPMAGKIFTVGGPLSPDAVLKKGGRTASLSAFAVGDNVTVTWRTSETGHIIQSLKGK